MRRSLRAALLCLALSIFIIPTGCKTLDNDLTAGTGNKGASNAPASSQILRIPQGAFEVRTIKNEIENPLIAIGDDDLRNLSDVMRLPDLERMSKDDSKDTVDSLQSIHRAKDSLKIDLVQLFYPEYNFKARYSITKHHLSSLPHKSQTTFDGTRTSELNAFLNSHTNSEILVQNDSLIADETIILPSNTSLRGNNCRLIPQGSKKAIDISQKENVALSGFVMSDQAWEYGIFIDNAKNFIISDCTIEHAFERALSILHSCENFIVQHCTIEYNNHGGLFICGGSHNGIIEQNVISNNFGSSNAYPGLFMGDFQLPEPGSAVSKFWEPDQTELVNAPHEIVIFKNTFNNNLSPGIYSHAGWNNYIVDNAISNNHKEGTCLDYGTAANYVSNNQYTANGERIGVDDGEPASNKLPGISLDNACYNIIKGNIFSYNGGSGVKAVRASSRNIVIDNTILNNNRGVSNEGHFFGIELASDMKPDYEGAAGLDFAPCFENIVTRNTITGPHYSGVYLGADDYCNDIFTNIIMGASDVSIETHSTKFNSIIDNIVDKPEFNCGKIIPAP